MEIYLNALPILLAIGTFLWLNSLLIKDSSIIDPCWGMMFIAVVWFYFAKTDGNTERSLLIAILVCIWGVRLSAYLFWRNWGALEDYRYQKFRENWGKNYWWGSLLQVFWLQPFLAWLISAPLFFACLSANEIGILDYIGVAVWFIGLVFETVGDRQMVRFKEDPANKGKVLDTGLWKYTRHPNYFGDSMCWWGYGLIALSGGYYLQLLGPLLMTFLLMRVSGVTLLERKLKTTKPQYADYVKKTNAFFPWFPKS